MKTHELFEQEGWQQIVVRFVTSLGKTLTEKHVDHIVKHAVEQAGGHYIKGHGSHEGFRHSYYYPEFSSEEAVKQLFKILRRMSRGKPRFVFEVVDLRGTSAGDDYEVHLEEPK